MAGEEDNETIDPTAAEEEDQLVIEDDGAAQEEVAAAQKQLEEAAAQIELVVLPLACVNEGKGAPLAMGVQRWLAQEVTRAGAKAAAPVFTALSEQGGQKVPALMIYRDAWTDERALEGIKRFPNAKRAVLADLHVEDDNVKLDAKLIELQPEDKLGQIKAWSVEAPPADLLPKLFGALQELAATEGKTLEANKWEDALGTSNHQAALSFLVGLGNLSALQGRVVPTTSDQLLNPLMDAINRDADMDPAMEALHGMVDILVGGQPDRAAVPLSVQALTIAAQRRPKDKSASHHLALVLRRLGDLPSAVNAFNQAFNLDPKDPAIATNFVATLKRAGDIENALKVAQFAAERGNEAPGVFAQLGGLLIDKDQFDEAEPYLRRAIDDGKVPVAYGNLANVLWERGSEDDSDQGKEDKEEAMALLREAVSLNAVAKSTLDMLLDLYEEEDSEEAGKLLIEATEKHPQSAAVLTSAANMYLDGDDPSRARPYLDRILALPRRALDDDAFARRSILTLDIEDFDDKYDAAVEKVTSDSEKDRSEAAKFMREIIGKDELFWQPHLMLALSVRENEGDASALAHLMNAVRLRPNDAEIRNLIAAILRKQGRPREAVEHLRVVVSLNPREIDPVVNLAMCMRDANMFDEARAVSQTALQMIPNHPQFKAILDSLPPPKEEQN
jgi:tetratricopeptide (TPR) repeat protein